MTMQPASLRHLTCARCGAAFTCGTGGRDGRCWCAEEAYRLPMPTEGDDCLCPRACAPTPNGSKRRRADDPIHTSRRTCVHRRTPNASAQGISLLGTWEIVEAQPAPWAEESQHASLTAAGKRLIKQVITFAPREVISQQQSARLQARRIRADRPRGRRHVSGQPARAQPDRGGAAARLQEGDSPGVDLKCRTGAYSYHFRDRNTALTALGNVIYTLKRQ